MEFEKSQNHGIAISGYEIFFELHAFYLLLPTLNLYYTYAINGFRLQANIASAVLTQIKLECTRSVPKVTKTLYEI